MTTDVPAHAAPMRWAGVLILPLLGGLLSVALPWFHPVLNGPMGRDELGYQYAGVGHGMWIVGFGGVAAAIAARLVVGMPNGFLGRYTAAYGGAACVVCGVVYGWVAGNAWHFNDVTRSDVQLHRGVQAGFYIVVAAGVLQVAGGLAVIAAGLADALGQGRPGRAPEPGAGRMAR